MPPCQTSRSPTLVAAWFIATATSQPQKKGAHWAIRGRCGTSHAEDDPALGTALDPERYDYTGAVLFNRPAPCGGGHKSTCSRSAPWARRS
ncbi:replication initiator [Streptomyces sp. NPDC003697]